MRVNQNPSDSQRINFMKCLIITTNLNFGVLRTEPEKNNISTQSLVGVRLRKETSDDIIAHL